MSERDRPGVLAAIWAQDARGVLAIDGAMAWHVPTEFAHFKATTLGATVVMGRLSWEALPPRFRPLPGRRNVVLTRDAGYDAPEVVTDVEGAAALPSATGVTWNCGGGEVYRALLPRTDLLVVTELEIDATSGAGADVRRTLAPDIDPALWGEVEWSQPTSWASASATQPEGTADEVRPGAASALPPAERERLASLAGWQEAPSRPRWRVRVLERR